MKFIKLNHLIILAVSLIFAAMSYAQPVKDRHHQRIKDKLNLTEAQENQIETLRTEHQKKMVDLRANLKKSKIEAKEVLKKDEINRNDYLAVQKKINSIENEIEMARANHMMDVLQILDKNQRKTFLEAERMGKKRMRMEPRRR